MSQEILISNHKKSSIKSMLILIMIFFLRGSAVFAQAGQNGQLRMTPDEMKAIKTTGHDAPGSSNYSAVNVIVVFGDPSKPGLYTILLKVDGNTKIAAHLHPDQRIGTVVSGTWYFGYGDHFDETRLKELPVGSVYSEVAGQNHFAMTKGPVIVEITGYGPSGVKYVNAADDPTGKNK
jgi:hypothetical protein